MKRLLLIFAAALLSCGAGAQEVTCLKANADGSVLLQSWGTGKNKKYAQREAERTAVNAILFTGVTKGVQSSAVKPILTKVNIRDSEEDYFEKFFREKGKYRKYVSVEQVRDMDKVKHKEYTEWKCSIAIKVDVSKLKDRMEKDGLR